MTKVTRDELIKRYCETQDATPEEVAKRLEDIAIKYAPEGFMLLRCEMFGSSRFGEQVILPYGGSATFAAPPATPISLRGLASDMSVVVAITD